MDLTECLECTRNGEIAKILDEDSKLYVIGSSKIWWCRL